MMIIKRWNLNFEFENNKNKFKIIFTIILFTESPELCVTSVCGRRLFGIKLVTLEPEELTSLWFLNVVTIINTLSFELDICYLVISLDTSNAPSINL